MNSHLQDEHKIFEGPYDIRAYNDKNMIVIKPENIKLDDGE